MKPQTILALTMLLLSGKAIAQQLSVDDLSSEYCQDDGANSVWREASNNKNPRCVFEFVAGTETQESEAVISLNGKVTQIFRTKYTFKPGHESKKQPSLGERHSYVLYTQDKTTKIWLTSHVNNSSCYVDTESCCGSYYDGKLIVERDGKRIVVPIYYYRGG